MPALETLEEFHKRVDGFSRNSLPKEPPFRTADSLARKIAPDGRVLPFVGDTLLFRLTPEQKAALAPIQALLYNSCPGMLAEKLAADSFHLTLHDLTAGQDAAALLPQLEKNRAAAEAIFTALRQQPSVPFILRSTWLFNMMNTSVVLGFAPVDEENCQRLMALFQRFQAVVPLSCPLTPHITIAYYRPGVYDDVSGLAAAICMASTIPSLTLELRPDCLVYARFRDMNDFR